MLYVAAISFVMVLESDTEISFGVTLTRSVKIVSFDFYCDMLVCEHHPDETYLTSFDYCIMCQIKHAEVCH